MKNSNVTNQELHCKSLQILNTEINNLELVETVLFTNFIPFLVLDYQEIYLQQLKKYQGLAWVV